MIHLKRLFAIAVATAAALSLSLAAAAFIIGQAASSARAWVADLQSDTLQVAVGGVEQVQSRLWRQLYEVRQLQIGDPAGGWRLTLPLLRLETDPLASLLGLNLHLRSVRVEEPVLVELSPWKLQPAEEPLDLWALMDSLEEIGDLLRLDSLWLPQVSLRVFGRQGEQVAEYSLRLSFGRQGGEATTSLVGRQGGREVLKFSARWRRAEGWTAHLRLNELEMQHLLAAPLAGLEPAGMVLDTELWLQGEDGLMPRLARGSLSVPDFRAGVLPWPISVRAPQLSLRSADSSVLTLQMPLLEGRLGTEPVEVENLSLSLQADPSLLHLHVQRQSLARVTELVSKLVEMPQHLEQNLREFALEGELENLAVRLPLQAPAEFSLSARARNLKAQPTSNSWPGFSGVGGEVFATVGGGYLELRDMPEAALHIPDYFKLWTLKDVSGRLGWRLYPDSVLIAGDRLRVHLGDGHIRGRLVVVMPLEQGAEPARLEALVEGENLPVTDAWLYTPRLPNLIGVADYLQQAVQGGRADIDGLSVWADLAGGGDFSLHMQVAVEEGAMEYAPDWPAVTRGFADLEILQGDVFVRADSGLISGARVGPGEVKVGGSTARPDWTQIDLSGDFAGELPAAIDFMLNSGLKEFMQEPLEDAWGRGRVTGRVLSGRILLPPGGSTAEVDTFVKMRARLEDARLTWTPWNLDIEALSGDLTLDTERNIRADNLRGRIFDKPVEIRIGGEGPLGESGSHTFFEVSGGFVNAEDLYAYVGEWNRFLDGQAGYRGRLDVVYGRDEIELELHSDGVGMALDVPRPLFKSAAEERQIEMILKIPSAEEDPVRMQITSGEVCTDLLYRNEELGGDLWFNDERSCAVARGRAKDFAPLQIFGNLGLVSVSEQVDMFRRMPQDEDSTLGRVEISVDRMEMVGVPFSDLEILAEPDGEGIAIEVSSEHLAGRVYVPDAADGVTSIEMDRVHVLEEYDASATSEHDDPRNIEASDIFIEDTRYQGVSLGQTRLQTRPTENGVDFVLLPVERSIISVASNSPRSDELLRVGWQFEPQERTSVRGHFVVDGQESEALKLFPLPALTRLGSVAVGAEVNWRGGVLDFTPSSLRGDVQIQILDTALDLSAAGPLVPLLTLTSIFNLGDLFGSLATLQLHRISGAWFEEVWLQASLGDTSVEVQELLAVGSGSTIYARGEVGLPSAEDPSVPLNLDMQVRLPIVKALPWYLAALGNVAGGLGLYLLDMVLGKPLSRAAVISARLSGTAANPELISVADIEDHTPLPLWMEDFSQAYSGSVADD